MFNNVHLPITYLLQKILLKTVNDNSDTISFSHSRANQDCQLGIILPQIQTLFFYGLADCLSYLSSL